MTLFDGNEKEALAKRRLQEWTIYLAVKLRRLENIQAVTGAVSPSPENPSSKDAKGENQLDLSLLEDALRLDEDVDDEINEEQLAIEAEGLLAFEDERTKREEK